MLLLKNIGRFFLIKTFMVLIKIKRAKVSAINHLFLKKKRK